MTTKNESDHIENRKESSTGTGVGQITPIPDEKHPPFMAPRPPATFVGRTTLINELKNLLTATEPPSVIVLGKLPGVGKTALAAHLAHDEQVLSHFQDGVLWAGLGQKPSTGALLDEWALALGVEFSQLMAVEGLNGRKRTIREEIGERRMLLVLDDVWDIEDAQEFFVNESVFDGGGGNAFNCVYLLTTRKQEIIDGLAKSKAEIELLPVLAVEEAKKLIAQLAPKAVQSDPKGAELLAKEVGLMPLALVLVGKYLWKQSRAGQRRRIRLALEKLAAAKERLALEMSQSPLYQPAGPLADAPLSLLASISVSYSDLDDEAKQALLKLSVHRPKPSFFSPEFYEAMGVEPQKFQQLLENGLVDIASFGREDVSLYEGFKLGYQSKPAQDLGNSSEDNDETFYEMPNIINDYARAVVEAEYTAARSQELHGGAVEYYSGWLTRFEEANNDATSYKRMFRYVSPRWQFAVAELLNQLGALDPLKAQLLFAKLYFDAFWWWGNYLEFPFCEQLLVWGQKYRRENDWKWFDYVMQFHKAYPTGYSIDWHQQDKKAWREVEFALRGLPRIALGYVMHFHDRFRTSYQQDLHRQEEPAWEEVESALSALDGIEDENFDSRDLEKDLRHIWIITNIFLAESLQYQDIYNPEAEELYKKALELVQEEGEDSDDVWNKPWVKWQLGDLYYWLGRYPEAQAIVQESREEAEAQVADACERDNEVIANDYRIEADIFFKQEEYEEAFKHYARAVLFAWGFHSCPNAPNFYSVAFHNEMVERTLKRIQELWKDGKQTEAEGACATLHKFWREGWKPFEKEEGASEIFQLLREKEWKALLHELEWKQLATHLFPGTPSEDEINQAEKSNYYNLTQKAFLRIASEQSVFR